MKKTLLTLLTILMITPIIGVFNSENVKADQYAMSCDAFEVSYINDDGSLSNVGCYDSFDSARSKMKENNDYVVRHALSYSPTKIVAMNSGLAYAYPYRSGDNTQSIYESLTESKIGTGVSTYVTSHYEMTYHDTTYVHTKFGYAAGWVQVTLNGFTGYADLEYVDLVPTKYIEKGLLIVLGGNDKSGANEQPFGVICRQNYYSVKTNGNYKDLVFTFYRAWSDENSDAISSSLVIGVAPEFMKEGVKYYSNDGINYFTDGLLTNYVGSYINYYQFLPLRTYTKISAATMNAFISEKSKGQGVLLNTGQDFINDQNEYGCNAAIILSMAIHESGWGKSNIAKGKFNLFGWGAFDSNTSNATAYASVAECVKAQMGDNLANYMDPHASVYFSSSLGNKGGGFITKYASDPYWAEKISSYYYSLDKYANNNNGKLTDYNTYTIGYVIENTEVKKEANSNSLTYYNTANKTGYQKNVIVVVLGSKNGYTKIQTTNPIEDSGMIYPIELAKGTLVKYNQNKSVGYIKTDKLIFINGDTPTGGNEEEPVIEEPVNKEYFSYVDSFAINNNTIEVNGIALITGYDYADASKVKHQIVLKNIEDSSKEYLYDLNTVNKNGFSLSDGYNYTNTGYTGKVDLKNVDVGNYLVYVRVTNNGKYEDILLRSSEDEFSNVVSTYKGYTNRLTTNEVYNYRFELEIMSTPLNYLTIKKPSTRKSLFSFNDFVITDDGYLYINGLAMIYYLNYNDINKIEYNVYLINSSNNYVKLDTRAVTSPVNYSEMLASKYDMSNICFEAYTDIRNLKGKYTMVIEIKNNSNNTTYVDYLEMDNSSDYEMPSNTISGKGYKVIKEKTRDRMVLVAGE